MVAVAQSGRAPGCGPGGRGFEAPSVTPVRSNRRADEPARLTGRNAPLAELAEQRTLNPQVLGSSPRGRTKSQASGQIARHSLPIMSPFRRLDDRLHLVADGELQRLRRVTSDRGGSLLPAGEADDDRGHDRPVLHAGDDAVELVPCTESHAGDATRPRLKGRTPAAVPGVVAFAPDRPNPRGDGIRTRPVFTDGSPPASPRSAASRSPPPAGPPGPSQCPPCTPRPRPPATCTGWWSARCSPRTDSSPPSGPPTTSACHLLYGIACYDPAQERTAYNPARGAGRESPARARRSSSSTVRVADGPAPTWPRSTRAIRLPAPPSLKIIQASGGEGHVVGQPRKADGGLGQRDRPRRRVLPRDRPGRAGSSCVETP